MARMYPNQLSPDTKSDAEKRLYEAFRRGLDDRYLVFHSVAWQSLDDDRRPQDGEADFVIAHPKSGILVLEVKGGEIVYAPSSGWTSRDHFGRAHGIKDPFAQARRSAHVLLDQLKRMSGDPNRFINLGHAVAFPDVFVPEGSRGLDRPRQIILDQSNLANISAWVGAALAYYRGQRTRSLTAPGDQVVQALMALLGKELELRPAMWGEFAAEQREFVRLTEQQYLVLDVLNRQRRAAICGCAGSGKTMLAAEKATRLAKQGFRVLLTCFNRNLAEYLQSRLKPTPRLEVRHFHGLCYDLARRAGLLPATEDEGEFQRLLPGALLDATDRLDVRYDALVVDEGQDFQSDWWIPLQSLLEDADQGILYVFYDDNQRIYVRDSEFPVQAPPYPLTRNCRNTQLIHRQVLQFYEGETIPEAQGPTGRPVEIVPYKDAGALEATLMDVLQRLVMQEHIPPEEIAVLTPMGKTSRIWRFSSTGQFRVVNAQPTAENQVYGSSIYAFKGLECAVAVLAELERCHQIHGDLNHLLYVACSRARNHLVVLLPGQVPQDVRALFGAIQGNMGRNS